jgi:hypothetical protein
MKTYLVAYRNYLGIAMAPVRVQAVGAKEAGWRVALSHGPVISVQEI